MYNVGVHIVLTVAVVLTSAAFPRTYALSSGWEMKPPS